MIKFKTGNQASSQSNEAQKKTQNQNNVQTDDVDEDQGNNLVTFQKKEKKQEKSKITKPTENTWQQQEDTTTNITPIPKAQQVKKGFDLNVTKLTKQNEEGAHITAEEFPELGQVQQHTQTKKQQQTTTQQQPQVTSGGRFVNSKKSEPTVLKPQAPQPTTTTQQPQQPQLHLNKGPVTFKHSSKSDAVPPVLQQPPVQQQPQPQVQEQQPQPETIKPKNYKFLNSNPVPQPPVVQQPAPQVKPVETTPQTQPQQTQPQIQFKTPTSFVNTKKEEKIQQQQVNPVQNNTQQNEISAPQVDNDNQEDEWEVVEPTRKGKK